MRLPVETIKAAILDPDQMVRDEAVYYFAKSFSPDPTIMPLAVQAVERYGLSAFGAYTFLQDLVQSDETLRWLIREIERVDPTSGEAEAHYAKSLDTALHRADLDLLTRHLASIRAMRNLDSLSQEIIANRMMMRSIKPEALWRRLGDFCKEVDRLEELTDADIEYAAAILDALSRHAGEISERTLTILKGDSPASSESLVIMSLRLAGILNCEAAIPRLVEWLRRGGIWICEAAHEALSRIGTDAVVKAVDNCYSAGNLDFRLSVPSLLENIHTDLSAQTGLALFAQEDDEELRGLLLESALLNFATEGIEPARQYVLDCPKSPGVLEVRSALLVACKLSGQTIPEYEAWLKDSANDVEFRKQWYKDHPLGGFNDDDGALGEEYYDGGFDGLEEPPLTIVRRAEKIGRNDPCPCGSGKKYKKCCYRNVTVVQETDENDAMSMGATRPSRAVTRFPVGTVAFYGPDDIVTTKVVASVIKAEGAEPILERWVGVRIIESPKAKQEMQEFFHRHNVQSVVLAEGNIGCPHEEGMDFPLGEDCPFCPFWVGKQGSGQRG